MSGIAGIVDLRGGPVDAPLLRRMTDALAFRGPDARDTWTHGPAGLGHTLLRTSGGSACGPQPCSLDGQVWITADARVDDRRRLVDALQSAGRDVRETAPDACLILHAYHAWGDACVERLLGDFAFAIWDGRQRRLFCARDRFGVKPFYYAHTSGVFVFSNTLECVRMHPSVRDALNERAIGDFLLFGFNEDTATTTFADVQRLPPAYSISVGGGSARRTCYWRVPAGREIRYRRPQDYVEHFSVLLRAAVADRVPDGRGGLWMSGGLDSTSIAATARDVLSTRGARDGFRAYSIVYDDLFPDAERRHAGVAAQALQIPIHFFNAGRYAPFHGWGLSGRRTPEPACDPFLVANTDQMHEASRETRVLLCGDGGDELLTPSTVAGLLASTPRAVLAANVARSLVVYGRRPALGIKTALMRKVRRNAAARPAYPAWLNSAFEQRCGLRERWARHDASAVEHALRPEACRRLMMAIWPSYFESWDAGARRVPLEARYPFFDARIVEYLMSIPPIPWCVDKLILRESMRGKLPETIRRRRKTPLAGDPLMAHLQADPGALDGFAAAPGLEEYVDRSAIPPLGGSDYDSAWLNVRPLCLNYWLKEMNHDGAERFRKGQGCEDAVRESAACHLR